MQWSRFSVAYAIMKALLPVRLMASVWATPWFARTVVIPVRNGVGRIFRLRKAGVTGETGTASNGAMAVKPLPREGASRVKQLEK